MEDTVVVHAQQNVSVVAFKLNQRTFALPMDVIVQIVPMMTITPIPHISKVVKGTINIRGEDVLVINLRSHFGLEEIELQLYTPLLLLKFNNRMLAIIVDEILDVLNLPVEKLTSLQRILPEGIEDIPMVRGIAYYNQETILVLEPERLFYNQHTAMQNIIETVPATKPAEQKIETPHLKKTSMSKKSHSRKSVSNEMASPALESVSTLEEAPAITDTQPAADLPAVENVSDEAQSSVATTPEQSSAEGE